MGWARGCLGGAILVATACGASDGASPADPSAASLYLASSAARRASLVASLVNPGNAYSTLRLAHYESGDANDWSLLAESNPRVDIIAESELQDLHGVSVGGKVSANARAIHIGAAALAGELEALIALGEDAFFHYPVQVSLPAETAAASREAFARYGFWTDARHGAGGLVRQETADGASVLAFTCSTCHAAMRSGALTVGVGNDALDLGRLFVDAAPGADPVVVGRYLEWGPGRLDVTTSDGTEPVRFADTRPVAWLGFVQADATVRVKDLAALAIRIETLIITSHAQADRPPRVIALALAAYLESLAATLPAHGPTTSQEIQGATLFAAQCESCHDRPGLTGAPVPLDVVGTDPTIGLSPDRGTGTYRVPSLHGVSTRGALLHDASLPTLAAMFDPARIQSTYAGGRRGPGAIVGHPFGLDLNDADRAAIVAYLETL